MFRPDPETLRLAPPLYQRVYIVAWATLDVDKTRIWEQSQQVRDCQAVLIVLIDKTTSAGLSEKIPRYYCAV